MKMIPTSNQTRAVETLKGDPSSFVTSLKLLGVIRLVIMANSRWITLAVNFPCCTVKIIVMFCYTDCYTVIYV